jgi:hypothetical protein
MNMCKVKVLSSIPIEAKNSRCSFIDKLSTVTNDMSVSFVFPYWWINLISLCSGRGTVSDPLVALVSLLLFTSCKNSWQRKDWLNILLRHTQHIRGHQVTQIFRKGSLCFIDYCLSLWPFSFGHCISGHLIDGFWLSLWYIQPVPFLLN